MAPRIVLAGEVTGASRELAAILAENGYEVQFCSLEEVLAEGLIIPDLMVVLDESPEAHQAVRRLKSGKTTREVPLIVTLHHFEPAAAALALENGADEFLTLPFQSQEVLMRVAVLLYLQEDRGLLLSTQREFSRIFQQTPQPLFLCDRQGEGYTLNPTLARLLGYSAKGDKKLPLDVADLLYGPEDRERLAALVEAGVDVIVIDAAQGDSVFQIESIRYSSLPVMVFLSISRPSTSLCRKKKEDVGMSNRRPSTPPIRTRSSPALTMPYPAVPRSPRTSFSQRKLPSPPISARYAPTLSPMSHCVEATAKEPPGTATSPTGYEICGSTHVVAQRTFPSRSVAVHDVSDRTRTSPPGRAHSNQNPG